MKMDRIKISLFVFSFLIFFSACEDDEIINTKETITTIQLRFTPEVGDVVNMSYQDLDGSGGDPPTISGGTLTSSTTYDVEVFLLDETQMPVIDVNEEIRFEDFEHQLFYSTSEELDLDFNYLDFDVDGKPLGLNSRCVAGNAGFGTLTITMLHQLDKNGLGVSDGIMDFAGGTKDFEISFDVTIF